MSDEESQSEEAGGLPGWVMTFADLMSLLMCFFVLLLSFSEMDVQKFKQLAGSMKNAFGVQKSVNVKDIPTGTSIIAREFSPGKPVPTSINEMRQQTTDDMKRTLDFTDSDSKGKQDMEIDAVEKTGEGEKDGVGDEGISDFEGEDEEGDSFLDEAEELDKKDIEELKRLLEEQFKEKIEDEAEAIREELAEELAEGLIEVEVVEDEVLIRIKEKGSFPSGNADIRRSFYPIMNKIGRMLKNSDNGRVVVAGHTDNVPISTPQYPSNWVLSAARAANVVHYLSKYSKVPNERMEIRAHAETIELAPNDTYANRAKNRRVEIIMKYDREDLVDTRFMMGESLSSPISADDMNIAESIDTSSDLVPTAAKEVKSQAPKAGATKPESIKPDATRPAASPNRTKTSKLSPAEEIKALEARLKKIDKNK